jgi:hypothetical protein
MDVLDFGGLIQELLTLTLLGVEPIPTLESKA